MTAKADAHVDEWLLLLRGAERDEAIETLHVQLLRVARSEVSRRNSRLNIGSAELDDLAHQAAADALVSILAKLDEFRGESRFTTWAFKFVIFEVSNKIGRHFWSMLRVVLSNTQWDLLPAAYGFEPSAQAEWGDLVGGLRNAIEEVLTDRQRQVFVALVLDAVPLDALVIETKSSRNAIYKTMFDARRKIRPSLVTNGYLDNDESKLS